ncbi:hypothetical protein BU23DRAFT_533568 [Bimuria novae-zelandiae CBS 107.79]|uniref:Poly(A) RNA polymerase mitochondrial-like central palm domain-containing protein n=1 Tax=Bimuria novae-zelandiae CBS 107.79 TaxID=1447943 RepID=A0A6A5V8E9_9PLEO|nr:hypothetical protein BU23DRAFT_533568 [Bimuria novae-zelandiae CBS 107.79]
MKLHHLRPICRASNRFSPSLALYQHFIVPYNALHQQRFSSSAPAPVAAEGEPSQNTQADDLPPPEVPPVENAEASQPLKITYIDPGRLRREAEMADMKKQLEKLQQNSEKLKKSLKGKQRSHEAKARESTNFIEEIMLKSRIAFDGGEVYEGLVVPPISAPQPAPEHSYPWASKTPNSSVDSMARLNEEIRKFWEYAKPNRAEVFARKNVVEQVRADVRQRFPGHVLEVFGSERTGISFATSDIDLRMVRREALDQSVSDKPPTHQERRDLYRDLYTLRYQVFGNHGKAAGKYLLANLLHARYPLLSIQSRDSGLVVQIVLSNNTAKSREYMHRYMVDYPYLRQVYAVVKTMFDQRGLSDVYRGGFGSYSIFMMIVASLQNQANQRNDAAGALVNFLYYWGFFKTRENGVSIDPPEYFDKKTHPVLTDAARAKIAEGKTAPLPDWMLSLRDPADATNDLGRKGSCILHVQATLRHLVEALIKDLNANSRPSLLARLVGDVYARDRLHRKRLAANGALVQDQVKASFANAARELRQKQDVNGTAQGEDDVHGFLDMDMESGGNAVASSLGPTTDTTSVPDAPEPPRIRYHEAGSGEGNLLYVSVKVDNRVKEVKADYVEPSELLGGKSRDFKLPGGKA